MAPAVSGPKRWDGNTEIALTPTRWDGAAEVALGTGQKYDGYLPRYKAARDAAVAGTGLCRIGFAGDSVTQGYLIPNKAADTWPQKLKNILVNSGIPSGGNGLSYVDGGVGFDVDPRLTFNDWTNRYAGAHGNQAYGDGKTVTLVADEPGTVVEVLYSTLDWTDLKVTIDGVYYADFYNDVPPALLNKVVTGLPNIAHTVQIESAGGSSPFLVGVGTRKASGLLVENGAISGSTTTDWLTSDFGGYRAATQFRGLDLVFIMLGGNDIGGGMTTADYKNNIRALTNSYPGTDIVLITETPNQNYDLAAYRDAVFEIGAEKNLPVVDMFSRWGSWTAAQANGFIVDYAHTTPAGAADIATAVSAALL